MASELYCKYCSEYTAHTIVKGDLDEGIPIAYLKCEKCGTIHIYGFISSEAEMEG